MKRYESLGRHGRKISEDIRGNFEGRIKEIRIYTRNTVDLVHRILESALLEDSRSRPTPRQPSRTGSPNDCFRPA